MTDGRQYQHAKDGYPDVSVCAECGVVLEPMELEAGSTLCDACDIHRARAVEWSASRDPGREE